MPSTEEQPTHGWIVILRWEEFQHRDAARVQVPTWIKFFTRLLSDEAYLTLSGHRRAVLHGIWLEYARTCRQLPDNTGTLTRRLNLKVTRRDLDALNHAGFIHFSASKPASTDTSTVAGTEKSREEKELRAVTSQETHTAPADEQPPDIEVTTIRATVAASLKQAQEAAAKEHAA